MNYNKIFALFIFVIFILYLSHTPSLTVTDFSTWISFPKYKPNVTMNDFLKDGDFFKFYNTNFSQEFLFRKIGHIITYSFLTYLCYINLGFSKKINFIFILALVLFIAIIDETCQYFILGRSGRFFDIILDFLSGLILLVILYKYKKSVYKR